MITVVNANARHIPLPDQSVQCVITSPPYYSLRDYQVSGQIGLEPTPAAYVANIVRVMREVWRVLRDDGTLWLNLGDSYARNGGNPGGDNRELMHLEGKQKRMNHIPDQSGLKEKDLVGIPWRVAFALQQPYVVPTCVDKETDRAWIAAMFDGEGCIGIRRFESYRKELEQQYQDGFVVYTTIGNNDIELLDRCVELTGFGSVRLKQKANGTDSRGITSRRDNYGWRLDGNKAVDIIRSIYPYLIAKRKQACIAYTLDTLNKNGHGSRAVPKEIQDKKEYLKDLIHRCNQREDVDLPSWIKEPKQEVQPGWYLRSDIIWSKPNPMPESVTDRPTKAHEYVFLLTKQARYYYDAEAIKEPNTADMIRRAIAGHTRGLNGKTDASRNDADTLRGDEAKIITANGRNRRSVWTVATESYSGSHFATFPTKLVEPMILAGTSQRGACPTCGAGWVRVVERDKYNPPIVEVGIRNVDKSRMDKTRKLDGKSYEWKQASESSTTIGWRPACACYAVPPLPAEPDDKSNGDYTAYLAERQRLLDLYATLPTVPQLVLDPFCGTFTVGKVCAKHGRDAIGTDLSFKYLDDLAFERTSNVQVSMPL